MECWNSTDELTKACKECFSISGGKFNISDERRFRNEAIDRLIWNAVFASNEGVKKLSQIRNTEQPWAAIVNN